MIIDFINPYFLNEGIWLVFKNAWAAVTITFLIFFACTIIIIYDYNKHQKPFMKALKHRENVLAFLNGSKTTDEHCIDFAEKYPEINDDMLNTDGDSKDLIQAWREYCETIITDDPRLIRVTVRSDQYFLHLGEEAKTLSWWANIFVAVGLTFTFLGIVAALTQTVNTLNSNNGGDMTPAIITLLEMTSVKFLTSIAGVGSSIILRFYDRDWRNEQRRSLEKICQALELGTAYISSQTIAIKQLDELKEQRAATQELATQLIEGFSNTMQNQMQPMLQSLNGISSHIEEFKNGGFGEVREALSEQLSKGAGAQMEQLANSLSFMTESLMSIHQKLDESGEKANQQIASAIDRLSETSRAMNEKYSEMNLRLEEMTHNLSSQAEEAVSSNTKLLGDAAMAITTAAANASTAINGTLDTVISKASENSAKVMETAFGDFSNKFTDVSNDFVNSISNASNKFELAAGSIERSSEAVGKHSEKLLEATNSSENIVEILNNTSETFKNAANPIEAASSTILTSVNELKSSMQKIHIAINSQMSSIDTITSKLAETSQSAIEAWNSYKSRFEGVDKSLEKVLKEITNFTISHGNELTSQTSKIDTHLARALDSLSTSISALQEYGGNIDELLTEMKRKA